MMLDKFVGSIWTNPTSSNFVGQPWKIIFESSFNVVQDHSTGYSNRPNMLHPTISNDAGQICWIYLDKSNIIQLCWTTLEEIIESSLNVVQDHSTGYSNRPNMLHPTISNDAGQIRWIYLDKSNIIRLCWTTLEEIIESSLNVVQDHSTRFSKRPNMLHPTILNDVVIILLDLFRQIQHHPTLLDNLGR